MSATIEQQLILHEDLRLKTYRCTAGKLSIAVGRNLDDVGIRPAETAALGITKASVIRDGVTRAQAMALLAFDLVIARAALDRLVPGWQGADRVRRKVLEDLSFNLGEARLAKFKNTLAAARRRDWAAVAAGMRDSEWFHQVGSRAPRLVKMMEAGADYV